MVHVPITAPSNTQILESLEAFDSEIILLKLYEDVSLCLKDSVEDHSHIRLVPCLIEFLHELLKSKGDINVDLVLILLHLPYVHCMHS